MASKPWLKLYTEILEDPKMGRLSDRLFRRVIEIFLLARKTSEDGSLPSVSDMAWSFRVSEAEMTSDLEALAAPGVEIIFDVDGTWYVTNFAERQDMEVSPSTERVRKFREKKREIPTSETEKEPEEDLGLISLNELGILLHETQCNVTETLHETTLREREEEKEKEKEGEKSREESSRAGFHPAFDALKSEIAVVMGVPQGPEAVAVIQELEKLGAIPEDIRSAAAWYASRKKTIRTVEQLLGPTKTAVLQRKQKGNDKGEKTSDPRSFITGEYAKYFKY